MVEHHWWDMELFVAGVPASQGSKRGFVHAHTGRVVLVDACRRTKDWRATIHLAASKAWQRAPMRGPVRLELAFAMPRPKSHYRASWALKPAAPKWHSAKPDAMKLARAVEDALSGVVYADDSLIVHETVLKAYGDTPGVMIRVGPAR